VWRPSSSISRWSFSKIPPAPRSASLSSSSLRSRSFQRKKNWLSVIPNFELDSDATLKERGGGAMMALETLPLRWEVGS